MSALTVEISSMITTVRFLSSTFLMSRILSVREMCWLPKPKLKVLVRVWPPMLAAAVPVKEVLRM